MLFLSFSPFFFFRRFEFYADMRARVADTIAMLPLLPLAAVAITRHAHDAAAICHARRAMARRRLMFRDIRGCRRREKT